MRVNVTVRVEGRVSVAVLVDEGKGTGDSAAVSLVCPVVGLGPPGDVGIGTPTLQERGFQEKHTGPASGRGLLS